MNNPKQIFGSIVAVLIGLLLILTFTGREIGGYIDALPGLVMLGFVVALIAGVGASAMKG